MSQETILRPRSWALPDRRGLVRSVYVNAGLATTLAATAWWLIEVTRGWAGRDASVVTVGAILIALAVVVVRPHRILAAPTLLAAVLSAGAFLVPLVAPTGWAGARGAASYVCMAWLCVVVAAVTLQEPRSRPWFATLLVASVPLEFMSGWIAWWGGNDPSRPMIGTFYWHNPFAAFLIPGGLIGVALFIWHERLFALLGIVGFSFACIGIVYSTSRASLATFVLGFVAIAVMAGCDRRRIRSLRRLVVAGLIGAAATYVIGGPPFFGHRGSPLAGEQLRAQGESLGQNGGYRLDFWREALTVFWHHPLTGGGYKSLVAESVNRVPGSWPLSPFAHNAYLQAMGQGGLLLAVPFLLAIGYLVLICLRLLIGSLRRREPSIGRYAVPVALGCVFLHAAVDFDWVYPASKGLAAVLAGLMLGRFMADRRRVDRKAVQGSVRFVLILAVVAGVGLLGLSAFEMRHGDHITSLPTANFRP